MDDLAKHTLVTRLMFEHYTHNGSPVFRVGFWTKAKQLHEYVKEYLPDVTTCRNSLCHYYWHNESAQRFITALGTRAERRYRSFLARES